VRLLPDWEIGSSDIHVIRPAGRVAKASARAFRGRAERGRKAPRLKLSAAQLMQELYEIRFLGLLPRFTVTRPSLP
jgi:hypothetical protein